MAFRSGSPFLARGLPAYWLSAAPLLLHKAKRRQGLIAREMLSGGLGQPIVQGGGADLQGRGGLPLAPPLGFAPGAQLLQQGLGPFSHGKLKYLRGELI